MRLIWVCVGVLAVGCGDSSRLTDYMDDDVPAGTCEDTEGEACETGGQGETCMSSAQCGGDLVCAATFDGDIGTFECQSACIPTMDESRWCMDDSACCDAAASCGPRGYCMIGGNVDSGIDTGSDDATTESGSTLGVDSTTDTSTDTGTGTATTTDSGTDAGTESSTGVSGG
jgi:hypothetical protein